MKSSPDDREVLNKYGFIESFAQTMGLASSRILARIRLRTVLSTLLKL